MGLEGNFPNMIQDIYENPTANILSSERLKVSPYDQEQDKDSFHKHCYLTLYWMFKPDQLGEKRKQMAAKVEKRK